METYVINEKIVTDEIYVEYLEGFIHDLLLTIRNAKIIFPSPEDYRHLHLNKRLQEITENLKINDQRRGKKNFL